jgi:hypothetical protein
MSTGINTVSGGAIMVGACAVVVAYFGWVVIEVDRGKKPLNGGGDDRGPA